MGVELHITRAEFWAENDECQITPEEWMAYVAGDPELQHQPENGKYFVGWLGESKYPDPWLDWSVGNISSKWPDNALYRKMLRIAKDLNATVQDDDGTSYAGDDEWTFDPTNPPKFEPLNPRPWWRFW